MRATEVLRESAGLVPPSLAEHGGMDLVTCPRPPVDSPSNPEAIAHGDRTVEGGPAHYLRIEKVLRVATDLPDPMILLNPTLSRGVGATREEPFGAVVDVDQLFNEPDG